MTLTLLKGTLIPTEPTAQHIERCLACGATKWAWHNIAPDTGRHTCSACADTLIPNESAVEHVGNSIAILLMGERHGDTMTFSVETVERLVHRLWRARQQLAGEDFTEPPFTIGVRT